ncbi:MULTISPECIES: ribosome-associated heat shock protein Hsp15 [Halomonadaceae]|jgi:ribosome-associated heat shock protein Hsp15|uniref:Heat shock protein 15 n=2 Tax=Vreelandella TaxID=3137766 RepID=A0A7Z0LTV5_9GAMM|nr:MULTISPECIES: ribosome-associated heat shock protein Hsp15 [Halomonas]AJY51451.1 RNA-binding S4 domain protein [Halomonas sp. KO116]EHA13902.1 ribosome-associated heat shock protein Hsp15 [Halomonas sp. HAL1]NYS78462.1 ribosome-associated heat shock protein Hsp15 [Halomonas glaciei]WKV94252.1 ribosome-associated heat shock protein Hsp15 [Halomonas sp. HAL1]|tara:strand:+ start:428 stop:817 length:390 start_codon:yes stop_codon:yes gene_type:complete
MSESVRLDKWLWAARFFKTRALAKKAIEGGKVHYDGGRAKTSKQVELGALIRVPQGWEVLEVEVISLSDQRRGAPEARTLYAETDASVQRRAKEAEARRLTNEAMQHPLKRPDKKQRRDIQRFQRNQGE